jgi:hypothetical protein
VIDISARTPPCFIASESSSTFCVVFLSVCRVWIGAGAAADGAAGPLHPISSTPPAMVISSIIQLFLQIFFMVFPFALPESDRSP